MIQLDLCKILLIEDNPGDALLVREALEEVHPGGFELSVAQTLKESTVLLRDGVFDVILLDLSLPDSQGLGTFQTLHTLAPITPIIILSGMRNDEVTQVAMALGAQDYLLKEGENYQVLSQAIRYSLGKKRLNEGLLSEVPLEKEFLWWKEASLDHKAAPTGAPLEAGMDLGIAMDQTVRAFSQVLGQNLAQITWDCLPVVLGSPIPLTEILQNLVLDLISDKECKRPKLNITALPRGKSWILEFQRHDIESQGPLRSFPHPPVWYHWDRCVERAGQMGGRIDRKRTQGSGIQVTWQIK